LTLGVSQDICLSGNTAVTAVIKRTFLLNQTKSRIEKGHWKQNQNNQALILNYDGVTKLKQFRNMHFMVSSGQFLSLFIFNYTAHRSKFFRIFHWCSENYRRRNQLECNTISKQEEIRNFWVGKVGRGKSIFF
jgi:hypothetical protein